MVAKQQVNIEEINNYVQKLANKISEMDSESKEIVKNVNSKDAELQKIVNSLKVEIENLKKSTRTAKEIVEQQKKTIKLMITAFKGLVKQDSFIKLKDKIDEWGPETFITKTELKKI
ncbi:hypothetical protein H8D36_05515 [archaeon]|nr:hypothetical protein [archaeon]MBL7057290.1 hypothetical protein [Candidatus Woesearchaeota archaeon]